jgi:excisionase family DNA binding protein
MPKTPKQVARETGRSLNSTYRALAEGEIPAARFGRNWRIPDDYYERMLAEAKKKKARAEVAP